MESDHHVAKGFRLTFGGGASLSAGKTVFTTSCGGCPTLSDAGTSGNVGPNLDDKPAEIAAVANYVSSVAGKGGDDGEGTEPPAGGVP